MIRIAICEDDLFYMEKERNLIEDYFKTRNLCCKVTTFESGIELTKDFREDYDVIFLDVAMEDMDGLEAARWLRDNDTKAFIVFLSGYPEYSLEGYKVEAHRFLLKNDENLESSLAECLDSAIEKMQRDEKKIELAVQGGTLSIAPSKIVYAESKVHKVIIHVLEASGKMREYYMYDRLDCVQEELAHLGFMRIHQSYLINKDYLTNVYRYKAELVQGIMLGISKKYYKDAEDYYVRKRGEF